MPTREPKKEKIYIYGKHALEEALAHAPQAIRKVFLDPHIRDAHLRRLVEQVKVPVAVLKAGGEGRVEKGAVHQGVIGVLDPSALLLPLDTFVQTLDMSTRPALVLLGEVQDPHNVGAIIRSAAAFGVSGVLIPTHNQAGITGAVVKSSAGMVFRVPLVSIGNVNQTVRALKDRGFWVYGLAMKGAHALASEKFDAPALFIMGNEAAGVRAKTLELCDVSLAIHTHSRCESLNVAASAAIVFHTWSTQHPEALENAKLPSAHFAEGSAAT
ncbi:MAG: 23S rRNA (guanosine(2251)-2'-O)-methyltransferase RlmB [Parcubacteria group bacterium 21-54-25]|nr:MAG: 23S rRNA (guanosine(2251)-2'-O)-methyltransferase RlmB [Parcubacteria group bacterium 21-54-25]HQU08148.1 23S rRNA (guanosine(2251)-2'-O)-methyltransferase RlmB [Candidatus Paceibacterota bacterium]